MNPILPKFFLHFVFLVSLITCIFGFYKAWSMYQLRFKAVRLVFIFHYVELKFIHLIIRKMKIRLSRLITLNIAETYDFQFCNSNFNSNF